MRAQFAARRGYAAKSGERQGPTTPADFNEAFNIGLGHAEDDPRIIAGQSFRISLKKVSRVGCGGRI